MIECEECGTTRVVCRACYGLGYIAEAQTEETKCCKCRGSGFFCKNCHCRKKAQALLLKKEGVFYNLKFFENKVIVQTS